MVLALGPPASPAPKQGRHPAAAGSMAPSLARLPLWCYQPVAVGAWGRAELAQFLFLQPTGILRARCADTAPPVPAPSVGKPSLARKPDTQKEPLSPEAAWPPGPLPTLYSSARLTHCRQATLSQGFVCPRLGPEQRGRQAELVPKNPLLPPPAGVVSGQGSTDLMGLGSTAQASEYQGLRVAAWAGQGAGGYAAGGLAGV